MAISYVGGKAGNRVNPTSALSVNFAPEVTPLTGDLVIVSIVVGSAAGNPAMAVTTPSGYTALGQLNQSAQTADTSQNVSWKFMGGTPDTAVTIPGTANNAFGQCYTIQVFRGVSTTTPMDVTAVSAGTTGTGRPDPGSITPITAGAWVVICGGGAAGTGAVYTAPTNYTTNFLTDFSVETTDAMIGSGYWTGWTSGAENPAVFTGGTTNAADSWTCYTLALRPLASATISGTITSSALESDIVAGGKTLIITLANDTWVASGATFDAQRDEILAGIDSAQSEAAGWDAVPKVSQSLTNIVRTSNTVCTITWNAFASYSITADETITVTVPATAVVNGAAVVATPTFTVTAAAAASEIVPRFHTVPSRLKRVRGFFQEVIPNLLLTTLAVVPFVNAETPPPPRPPRAPVSDVAPNLLTTTLVPVVAVQDPFRPTETPPPRRPKRLIPGPLVTNLLTVPGMEIVSVGSVPADSGWIPSRRKLDRLARRDPETRNLQLTTLPPPPPSDVGSIPVESGAIRFGSRVKRDPEIQSRIALLAPSFVIRLATVGEIPRRHRLPRQDEPPRNIALTPAVVLDPRAQVETPLPVRRRPSPRDLEIQSRIVPLLTAPAQPPKVQVETPLKPFRRPPPRDLEIQSRIVLLVIPPPDPKALVETPLPVRRKPAWRDPEIQRPTALFYTPEPKIQVETALKPIRRYAPRDLEIQGRALFPAAVELPVFPGDPSRRIAPKRTTLAPDERGFNLALLTALPVGQQELGGVGRKHGTPAGGAEAIFRNLALLHPPTPFAPQEIPRIARRARVLTAPWEFRNLPLLTAPIPNPPIQVETPLPVPFRPSPRDLELRNMLPILASLISGQLEIFITAPENRTYRIPVNERVHDITRTNRVYIVPPPERQS